MESEQTLVWTKGFSFELLFEGKRVKAQAPQAAQNAERSQAAARRPYEFHSHLSNSRCCLANKKHTLLTISYIPQKRTPLVLMTHFGERPETLWDDLPYAIHGWYQDTLRGFY